MRTGTLASLFALACCAPVPAYAQIHRNVDSINSRLCGRIVDLTRHCKGDARIYSAALCERRDLYIYLPPNYDPKRTYPFILWLHSYTTDEREFIRDIVGPLDRAISCGELPPMVVAAPDGSIKGNSHFLPLGSWYINSHRGRFADYILEDIVGYVEQNYSVSRDPACRVIAGFSMGGFGAYNLGLRHPDQFKLLAGISPPLNMRYGGPSQGYRTSLNPADWSLRLDYTGRDVVGKFYGGLVTIRAWEVVKPVFGSGQAGIEKASENNPIELLERLDVQPGVQHYFVSYGGRDELKMNEQVESFLPVAKNRGLDIESHLHECGDHSIAFMVSTLPECFAWVKSHIGCVEERGQKSEVRSQKTDVASDN